MRVTAERKRETRKRILQSAAELFARSGFEQAATRDIAAAADVAVGTLFNYFSSKEAIAVELVVTALRGSLDADAGVLRANESLEESFFAFIMIGINQAEPHRTLIGPILPILSNPLAQRPVSASLNEPESTAESFQRDHLGRIGAIMRRHGLVVANEADTILLHLYWSLYLGALTYWANDASPAYEDTLAVVDRLTRVFGRAVRAEHELQLESKGGVG